MQLFPYSYVDLNFLRTCSHLAHGQACVVSMEVLPISKLEPTGRTALDLSICLLILCVLAVSIRVGARYFARIAFAAEDLFIILALVSFSAYVGVFLRGWF